MSLTNIFKSKLLFILFLILLYIGLFDLVAIDNDTRLKREAWNAGHIIIFFLFWLFVVNLFPWFRPLKLKIILLILLITLFMSIIIESVQSKVGRWASYNDIKLNLAGSIALIAFYVLDFSKNKLHVRMNLVILSFAAIILSWSTLKIFIDEIYILTKFPVLSDFTSPFENTRWRSSFTEIDINNDVDKKYLVAKFKPSAWYSSVEYKYFYKRWKPYTYLYIEVENLEKNKINLSIRIHDKTYYQTWYVLDGRYLQSFILNPGDNILKITTESIKNAPEDRLLDMSQIKTLIFSVRDIEQDQLIKIKRIYLK